MNIKFNKCNFEQLTDYFEKYRAELSSPIDFFLEEHIAKAEHFMIFIDNNSVGYFSIFNKEMLVQFYVDIEYRAFAQEVFFKLRRMQLLSSAFVATSDEFFLANALDDYRTIEKQAYFFQDSGAMIDKGKRNSNFKLTIASLKDIDFILENSGDFFEALESKIINKQIYIAKHNEDIVGFGVIEGGILLKECVSIGMYVLENSRQKGYGRDILINLKEVVYNMGLKPIAGCWYYNHFSKKTLESAGMYSKTRLLKINY